MTGFKDAYVPVFEAVQEILQKQKELQQVVLGKNLKQLDSFDKLPIAIINTDEAKVAPSGGLADYELKIPIILDVIIVEYEAENWFDKMSKVMGEIVDAFLDDTTLGGRVRDLVWTGYAPGTITFEDAVFYGGEIRFTATLDYEKS